MSTGKPQTRLLGLMIGLAFLAVPFIFPPPSDMPPEAWRVTGAALLMATWWMTGAAPIPVTALLPLALFPLLDITSTREAAAPYAHPLIFLFLGGFILGIGMQRWSLHVRIGLRALMLVGTRPSQLSGGFMLSTAFISMWVSNTATTIMMLPVGISVLALLDRNKEIDETSRRNLGIVLLLAIAYGATIGGLATLIGTPTNALFAAYIEMEHGITIGFARWMMIGLPVVAIMLTGCWLVLNWIYPVSAGPGIDAGSVVAAELHTLGPISVAEIRVACVFIATATAWMTRPLISDFVPGLDDTVIAITGALLLFFIPCGMKNGGPLLRWEDLSSLPWGVLILFGGGLSLAAAISSSGLAAWLGAMMSTLENWPVFFIVAVATIGMIFLTELTSNTASAAAFLPLAGAVALGIGFDPLMITIPITIAASCAFMLPVATPPNAIVYSSGRLTIPQMVRAGLWLNLLGAVVILTVSYTMIGWLFPR